MRNLSDRINDVSLGIYDVTARQIRYEESNTLRKGVARIFSGIVKTTYPTSQEKKFYTEALNGGSWAGLIDSLKTREEFPRRWQESAVSLGEMNSDVINFLTANFRNIDWLTDLDPSEIQLSVFKAGNQLRLGVKIGDEDNVELENEFEINESEFDQLDNLEKALLLTIPGAIEDAHQAELEMAILEWQCQHPVISTMPYV